MPSKLHAMISSTARDLTVYRRAVVDACLSVDVFPSIMENLPASSADAIEASMRMVDGADIYLGVVANRYGYIPADHPISITEMEYWRAVERGIPILIYVLSDGCTNADLPDLPAEDETHQQQLARFKEHLTTHHVVNFFCSPADLSAQVLKGLWHAALEQPGDAPPLQVEESREFAEPLRQRFEALGRTIDTLTEEQFEVLNQLRYHRRLSIAGCAGSGKTLVGIQKALLLDRAGSRTMVLCHNPNLAAYIASALVGTRVAVYDFTAWIRQLNGSPDDGSAAAWSHLEEPTEDEIATAFDRLVESDLRYDAVIVDEGQDFRDEWWLLVEAALVNPEHGILYIFHDDNQALLPFRSRYPITASPFVLSRNCRNAGQVYEVVRRFHSQSPAPSNLLKGEGSARRWIYNMGEEKTTMRTALREMLEALPAQNVVILTSEPDPVERSLIYGAQVEHAPKKRWQDFVMRYLRNYGKPNFTLSGELTPTPEDVRLVQTFAARFYPKTWGEPRDLRNRQAWRWTVSANGFGLLGEYRLAKFTFEDWHEDLPVVHGERIRIGEDAPDVTTVPLYTISSFKGLESDGVILFLPNNIPDLESQAYVGTSRAKLMLYIVQSHINLKEFRLVESGRAE